MLREELTHTNGRLSDLHSEKVQLSKKVLHLESDWKAKHSALLHSNQEMQLQLDLARNEARLSSENLEKVQESFHEVLASRNSLQ